MSNQIKDGGPAFPTSGEVFVETVHGKMTQSDYGMGGSPGMSLRDWFAGMVVSGITSNTGFKLLGSEIATFAYEVANDMINERKRGEK